MISIALIIIIINLIKISIFIVHIFIVRTFTFFIFIFVGRRMTDHIYNYQVIKAKYFHVCGIQSCHNLRQDQVTECVDYGDYGK